MITTIRDGHRFYVDCFAEAKRDAGPTVTAAWRARSGVSENSNAAPGPSSTDAGLGTVSASGGQSARSSAMHTDSDAPHAGKLAGASVTAAFPLGASVSSKRGFNPAAAETNAL